MHHFVQSSSPAALFSKEPYFLPIAYLIPTSSFKLITGPISIYLQQPPVFHISSSPVHETENSVLPFSRYFCTIKHSPYSNDFLSSNNEILIPADFLFQSMETLLIPTAIVPPQLLQYLSLAVGEVAVSMGSAYIFLPSVYHPSSHIPARLRSINTETHFISKAFDRV